MIVYLFRENWKAQKKNKLGIQSDEIRRNGRSGISINEMKQAQDNCKKLVYECLNTTITTIWPNVGLRRIRLF